MLTLPRLRFGRSRETETLERRVATLQTALRQCADVAGRWTAFRGQVTVAIAVLMMALGFALGIYCEPIHRSVVGLAQAVGVTQPAEDSYALDAAYQKGDFETVLRLARPLAAEGDARAQSMLGFVYYRGRGAPQDHNEAVKWFRRAADQGEASAQFHLGVMFSEGRGVPQDYAEAAKWYRLAADQGDAPAQYNLGLSYAKGEVGEPDNVSAYVWFNLAAARFPTSDIRRSVAAVNRDLVASKMTPDQVADAQRRAREWNPK
jgi:uncharacterized protein